MQSAEALVPSSHREQLEHSIVSPSMVTDATQSTVETASSHLISVTSPSNTPSKVYVSEDSPTYSVVSVPLRFVVAMEGPVICTEKHNSRTPPSSGKVKLVHLLSADATEAEVNVGTFKMVNSRDDSRKTRVGAMILVLFRINDEYKINGRLEAREADDMLFYETDVDIVGCV